MSEYYKKLPAVCDLYQPISIDEIMIAEGRCWLPIGEKKEFEEWTLFGKVSRGGKRMLCLSLDFKLDSVLTHYLSPPPIVSRGCVSCPTHNDVCFSKNALIESQLKELEAKDKRISELEESLRKERESKQWHLVSNLDDGLLYTGAFEKHDGTRTFIYRATTDHLENQGYIRFYPIPNFKHDNSEKIKELEKEIESLKKESVSYHSGWLNIEDSLSQKKAELAKLKEEGK